MNHCSRRPGDPGIIPAFVDSSAGEGSAMRKILVLPAAGAWLVNLDSLERNAGRDDLFDVGRR